MRRWRGLAHALALPTAVQGGGFFIGGSCAGRRGRQRSRGGEPPAVEVSYGGPSRITPYRGWGFAFGGRADPARSAQTSAGWRCG